jgi:hypothetical protein
MGGERPHQLPLSGDDEVQTPEAHVRTRGPVGVVAGHPKPDESDEMRQLSVFGITG